MRAALCLLLATLGCAEAVYPPRLSSISPSEGANDVDVTVTIRGENLQPRIRTDFDRADQSGWDRTFTAALIPVDTSLPEVPLSDVLLDQNRTLVGTIRAGAARGFYGLRVVDGFGREGFVPEVYRVVASPTKVASFKLEPIGPQRPGVPFTVQLSALDADGRVVDGFTAGVDVKDGTGALTPGRVEPFVLGRARAQLTVAAFSSANTVTATDAQGRTGSSNPFAVLPGLAVELVFLTAAQTLTPAQCSQKVELEARDTFGFPAKVEAMVESELSAAPPQGVTFFSDAACTQEISLMALAAGESRISFYFRAGSTPGLFVLRVVPLVLPSASQPQTVTP
jgi:hypothetical protein